jgi:hypothetical protein
VRTYWDTSAAINAALSPEVFSAVGQRNARGAVASFGGVFRHDDRTRRGDYRRSGNTDRMIFTQNECGAWLRKFAARLEFVELTKDEALNGLDKAQRLSVQGARVYDYWHALVSNKAKSSELITRNTRHFQGIAEDVAWP